MRFKFGHLMGAALLFFVGCSAPKVTTSYRSIAEQAVAAGNYEAATENWKLYFDQQMLDNEPIAPELFAEAGQMAFKANKPELALNWLKQAQASNYDNAEMYVALAELYKQENNLSKELESLEFFRASYPTADQKQVTNRLFEIYTEINAREKAVELWNAMSPESQQEERYLEEYFSLQKQLKNEEVADSVASALLNVNPNHTKALEWLGAKYYNQAEDRYQKEMKAYEKNHTRVQHIKLTQALKEVTADFRKSAEYFKTLWEQEQDSKYATYLVNIYNRFDDKKTSDYYRKFLK